MGWKPNHGRMKERYNPRPNAEERRHEQRLEQMPCINCGSTPVEVHHLMQDAPGKRWRRDHRFQIPVCADCHRGPNGIHGLGSERGWAELHGLDLPAIALGLWNSGI